MILVYVSALKIKYLFVDLCENGNHFAILRFHILDKNAIDIFETHNFVWGNTIKALVVFSTDVISIYIH